MNKKELINAIAEQAELSKKDAAKAVEAFVEVVTKIGRASWRERVLSHV